MHPKENKAKNKSKKASQPAVSHETPKEPTKVSGRGGRKRVGKREGGVWREEKKEHQKSRPDYD
jgi:hypothetical protein